MPYPYERPRRMRRTESLRRLIRETSLSPNKLILPLFVVEGLSQKVPIPSMPGVFRLSLDWVVNEAREAAQLGVGGVILFGVTEHKDEQGSGAWDPKGLVQRATTLIKEKVPELTVITDVCLCEYTEHGHCGVVVPAKRHQGSDRIPDRRSGEFEIDNDRTLDLLVEVALSHARAGADIVAPSDMMDGRVFAIRETLNQEGFVDTGILSYAVKYASAFYGPFREAAGSTPQFGDRRTYQMDPANAREGVREARMDIEESADIVMVKPALSYLDVIADVRQSVDVPVAAYQVSGEYAMIKSAAQNGLMNESALVLETLTSIRRAGADMIVTYFAKDAAKLL